MAHERSALLQQDEPHHGIGLCSIRMLAFHEPLEYKPIDRWYRQFDNTSIAQPLRVGHDIHGVVGATLSTHATTRGVRRALAYYQVLLSANALR